MSLLEVLTMHLTPRHKTGSEVRETIDYKRGWWSELQWKSVPQRGTYGCKNILAIPPDPPS